MKKNKSGLYTKYGCFSRDGTEFVIKNTDTPRPWINYLSNGEYCVLISQRGGGYSFYLDSELNRLTRWSPGNYLTDEPGRYLYVYDRETGKNWSATRAAGATCRHGLGYTSIKSTVLGIETGIDFFVPFGESLELWLVKIRNTGNKKRELSVFPFIEWMTGNYFDDLSMRNINVLMNRGEYDEKNQVIFTRRMPKGNVPWKYETYMAVGMNVQSCDMDYENFMGRYGTYKAPEAVKKGRCTGTGKIIGIPMVGTFQCELTLSPGQEKSFPVIVGIGRNREEILKSVKKYRNTKAASGKLEETRRAWKQRICDNINVDTPDKDFNLAANVWLKYQIFMNNDWGRSATYYHEGSGEFGYRNTAQDAWAMVSIYPEYSLKRLIKLAEHQRKNGQPLPGWSLESGSTTHRPPSDFPIWLPMLLLAYVKETGRVNILRKDVKFFDGGSASLYEHARRATMFLLNVAKSKRGLPLMGTQDWNDAFDRTGIGGKGESVWLGMGLCVALNNMKELALRLKDTRTVRQCEDGYRRMKRIINRYAWDGHWYCYAFNDYGEPIGSHKNTEDKVQLNAQTWAIMAGLPDDKQLKSMLRAIDNDLETPYGPALFTPPYTKYNPRIGRITAFAPGTKENAAVFAHGGAFKIAADTSLGRAEHAYKTLRQLLPMDKGKDIEKYKTEPYILPEYVIGPGNTKYGEGAFTWLTGSADWLFVCATERILGIKPDFGGLFIDPCLPGRWKHCRISRRFRGMVYDISIKNPKGVNKGVKYITVDGKRENSNFIKARKDGKTCKVTVIMG
ncbi:MAG: hypothetical protein JXJ19_01695 [Elusimicrobia bacterium]|nr:hypothetical protein [Elusimicrobiota bacterium]